MLVGLPIASYSQLSIKHLGLDVYFFKGVYYVAANFATVEYLLNLIAYYSNPLYTTAKQSTSQDQRRSICNQVCVPSKAAMFILSALAIGYIIIIILLYTGCRKGCYR